jgi:erythromycin esterase-like protein
LIVSAVIVPALAQPTPAETEWVRLRAIPLKGVEAGSGFEDLEPLREMFTNARVVGLGEATHGTREHFQMKHRLVEFLASECGYTIFSIEASSPEAFRVDDYVSRGKGDPARLIGGMYFWTWNTEEVLDMVEWMREFNQRESGAHSGRSIAFTGFDMQETRVAKRIVQDFVDVRDNVYLPTLIEKWRAIENAKPGDSGGFGASLATFPIEKARGKKIVLRGFIKTQNVHDGYAGLWWRVDGPRREQLAFDNMEGRGPSGTTDWQEYSITLDVPQEAININFGCMLTDRGTAWFDSLAVEVDGEVFTSDEFDFSFDGPKVNGFSTFMPGYKVGREVGVAFEGAASMRIASESRPGDPRPVNPGPITREVLDYLTANKEKYLAAGAARTDVEWALHNAEIVHQWARMIATMKTPNVNVRDESMARNVTWLLEQNPGAKVVLWAHNFHMATQPLAQGGFLRAQLGDGYLAVGFTTGEGKYYAMPGQDFRGTIHELQEPTPGSVESILASTGLETFALDVRSAPEDVPGAAWLFEPRPTRTIGALAMKNQLHPRVMGECFDLIIHTQRTSAARQLKTPPGPYDPP